MAKSVDDRGRGARLARRDEGAYCWYVTEEQRRQPGCIGREGDRLGHSRALTVEAEPRARFGVLFADAERRQIASFRITDDPLDSFGTFLRRPSGLADGEGNATQRCHERTGGEQRRAIAPLVERGTYQARAVADRADHFQRERRNLVVELGRHGALDAPLCIGKLFGFYALGDPSRRKSAEIRCQYGPEIDGRSARQGGRLAL